MAISASDTGKPAAPWPGFLSQAQALFLLGYIAVIVAYYIQPKVPGWITVGFMPVLGLAVAGMILGVVLNPSRRKFAWLLLLVGMALNLLGAGTALAYTKITDSVPYPGLSDALELSSYVFFVAGLVMLASGGNIHVNRRAAAVAVAVTGLTFGLFSWPLLISPNAHASGASTIAKVVSIAYPTADILLLLQICALVTIVLAMRHFRHGTRVSNSFWLISIGALGLLASDSLFAYAILHWSWSQPSVGDAGWFIWFGTWALAFLAPEREMSARMWYLRLGRK